MPDKKPQNTKRREYPPLYEKMVPIALGIIGLAVAAILVIILLVVLGLIPGS